MLRLPAPAGAVGVSVWIGHQGWGLLNTVEWPFWVELVITVIVLDFVVYMQHLMFHAVPILWRLHMMHHADLDIDLTTGSVNFPTAIYENSPELIDALAKDMQTYGVKPEMEIFDTAMINNALDLLDRGLAEPPLHFDFVMGLKGAIPATIENLVHLKNNIPPDATWTVAGMGPAQLIMGAHAILMGGHVRVGLEDNLYYRRGEKATNPQLVERMVRLAHEMGREVASPDEARRIL